MALVVERSHPFFDKLSWVLGNSNPQVARGLFQAVIINSISLSKIHGFFCLEISVRRRTVKAEVVDALFVHHLDLATPISDAFGWGRATKLVIEAITSNPLFKKTERISFNHSGDVLEIDGKRILIPPVKEALQDLLNATALTKEKNNAIETLRVAINWLDWDIATLEGNIEPKRHFFKVIRPSSELVADINPRIEALKKLKVIRNKEISDLRDQLTLVSFSQAVKELVYCIRNEAFNVPSKLTTPSGTTTISHVSWHADIHFRAANGYYKPHIVDYEIENEKSQNSKNDLF